MDSFFNFVKNIIKIAKDGFSKLLDRLFFLKKNKIKNHFEKNQEQINLDKKLVFSLAKSRIPNFKQIRYIKNFLTPRELFIIRVNAIIIIICIIFVGSSFYKKHLRMVPVEGGKYIEALIGAPVHVNPLYSGINDVDNDLSSLIYSSLFKRGKNGELVNDIADNYQISADGKIYTFVIKENIIWHSGNSLISGSKLNADDIIFTFTSIKNKQYKSPLRSSFNGVEIEKVDDKTIKFILSNPYAAFLDLLTFGILPANLWSEIPPESFELTKYQKKPIGSGPYQFSNFVVDNAGNIKEYNLIANKEYYGRVPYIDITFKFYPSFEEAVGALNDGQVDGVSYLPEELRSLIITPKAERFNKLFLPQMTAIFLNKDTTPALGDKAVRQALAYALDRNKIINESLSGNAYIVDGPILSDSFAYNKDIKKYNFDIAKADDLLNKTDWKIIEVSDKQVKKAEEDALSADEKARTEAEKLLRVGEGSWRQKNNEFLIIRLDTVDRNENKSVVNEIKKSWENIGVKVELEILPVSQVQTQVIKDRNFGALFYGQVIGADPDPYAFWHSSQTGSEGFNIANFANKEVDQLLEDARLTSEVSKRQELYKKFQDIIAEEEPAIFMYSPVYTYVQGSKLKGFDVKNILLPSDRLSNINEWYIQTGKKLIW